MPLAAQGFIVVLPGTESGLSPSHDRFANDLVFAARAVQAVVFFAASAGTDRSYGGHSMGGGAAFLAAAKDQNARALFVMAPAETNPSAIAAKSFRAMKQWREKRESQPSPKVVVYGRFQAVVPRL